MGFRCGPGINAGSSATSFKTKISNRFLDGQPLLQKKLLATYFEEHHRHLTVETLSDSATK